MLVQRVVNFTLTDLLFEMELESKTINYNVEWDNEISITYKSDVKIGTRYNFLEILLRSQLETLNVADNKLSFERRFLFEKKRQPDSCYGGD